MSLIFNDSSHLSNALHNLRSKLFTENERLLAPASLAARFAAKEALYKALSPVHGLAWHDAEVINHLNGKPDFLFRGAIADLVDGAPFISRLSHDAISHTAMVVIER
jgi:holo-[acyl-carrier protein] synthase